MTKEYRKQPHVKLQRRLSKRVKKVNNSYTCNLTHIGLGSWKELVIYIENQFYNHPLTNKPMTWEDWNYTGWHLDHIKPIKEFDNAELANHYTNLRPIWKCDHDLKTYYKIEIF